MLVASGLAYGVANAVGKFDWNRRRVAYKIMTDRLAGKTESYLILGGEPRLWLRG